MFLTFRHFLYLGYVQKLTPFNITFLSMSLNVKKYYEMLELNMLLNMLEPKMLENAMKF